MHLNIFWSGLIATSSEPRSQFVIKCKYMIKTKPLVKLDNSKLGSTQQWMTLTCCQNHILTENIWFVWSETSYSGDERRCYRCGTTKRTVKIELLSQMEAGGWVSQFSGLKLWLCKKKWQIWSMRVLCVKLCWNPFRVKISGSHGAAAFR